MCWMDKEGAGLHLLKNISFCLVLYIVLTHAFE